MYDFILANRERFLHENGPLQAFRCHCVRFINRKTVVYHKLLQKTLQPRFMADAFLRGLEFEALYKPAIQAAPGYVEEQYRLIRAEIAALEIGDYPHFLQSVESVDLALPDGSTLTGLFTLSGFDHAIGRIKALSHSDREEQAGFIRNTFLYIQARAVSAESPAVQPNCEVSEWMPGMPGEFAEAAGRIARQLSDQSIRAGQSATWIAPRLMRDLDRYQLGPLGPGLYDGQCGIAIFFAALHRITGDSEHAKLALAALNPLLASLDAREKWLRVLDIGAGSGLGGIIYALTLCGKFLSDARLFEAALRCAELIDSTAIKADVAFDLIGGGTGASLGLLRLHRETSESWVLERAMDCGMHLLVEQQHRDYENSSRSMTPYIAGFSHGGASVAYAFLRLHAVTSEAQFLTAATDTIRSENRIFRFQEKNWPAWQKDRETPGQPIFTSMWCHGAPGIALARIGGLTQLDTAFIQTDIANALETTQKAGLSLIDHCCCGNCGRIEVLFEAGRKLQRYDLQNLAFVHARKIRRLAESSGGYNCFGRLPRHMASPGFFSGLAGIGYTFLRLTSPEKLPSVLLFE
jgi:type 2 lantibiotic biosynthesis protein LanM